MQNFLTVKLLVIVSAIVLALTDLITSLVLPRYIGSTPAILLLATSANSLITQLFLYKKNPQKQGIVIMVLDIVLLCCCTYRIILNLLHSFL